MLSDEEKKAIEILKKLQKTKPYIIWGDGETPYNKSNMVSTILELIEKQSKEIEELKEDSCCMTTCLRRDKEKLFLEDKIKAKIEYLLKRYDTEEDFCSYDVLISILQSLLEKE